jgi:N4-gp56 family major capsid protein
MRQFAGAYRHSDIVIMTALSDVIELSLRDIARDIAKRMDTHIRDTISGSGTQIYGSGQSYTHISQLVSSDVLRSSDLLKAATLLDAADNPRPPDGHYPMVTHPRALYDLQSSLTGNSWLEINKYGSDAQVQHLYRGEIGRIFGVRVVTSSNTKRLLDGDGMSSNVSGYRSFVFAPDSYYVTEVSDMTAKTFVKQLGSAGALDPVNQVATVGAKVFFTAVPATWSSTEDRMIRVSAASIWT